MPVVYAYAPSSDPKDVSLTSDNVTDVDEIMPDTPGLILPDGSVS